MPAGRLSNEASQLIYHAGRNNQRALRRMWRIIRCNALRLLHPTRTINRRLSLLFSMYG